MPSAIHTLRQNGRFESRDSLSLNIKSHISAKMPRSKLQDHFLREIALCFSASQRRITRRLSETQDGEIDKIVEDEMRGLYHGLFVTLDGGTALADHGLIAIVDEDGVAFDRYLHERCFDYWPKNSV